MTISQIRLLAIYLSKINPKDINSREVTFMLDEYTKIMQFKRSNTTQLINTAEKLLGLTVTYFDKTGQYTSDGLVGFTTCQIFKRFRLYKNDEGKWLVTIDCHDDVVNLMFDLQRHYFKYELWNALQLTSPNQQHMYELLKQYEYAGVREIGLSDLRKMLGLKSGEYPRWERFKTRVLDAAQEALANYTDIKFTWEVAEKAGKGGKIIKLRFHIEKNSNYVRRLTTFEDYLTEQAQTKFEGSPEEFEIIDDDELMEEKESLYEEHLKFLAGSCGYEFTNAEMQVLYNLILKIVPYKTNRDATQLKMYNYLKRKYDELKWRNSQHEIKNRMGYIKKIIEADIVDFAQ